MSETGVMLFYSRNSDARPAACRYARSSSNKRGNTRLPQRGATAAIVTVEKFSRRGHEEFHVRRAADEVGAPAVRQAACVTGGTVVALISHMKSEL
jgi:hypothetical protein